MHVQGRGLGLRREFASTLAHEPPRTDFDFLEVVPDNWMRVGGESARIIDALAERYPMVAHSLSLSIGDAQPLDRDYLDRIKAFLDRFGITVYGDHVSLSRDSRGYLYELIPMPRTEASLGFLVAKIRAVQDHLERRIALENISYYHEEPGQMPEAEFLARMIEGAGCALLLDVNNVYVNARNHGWDAQAFLDALPADAVAYYHVAGHLDAGPGERVLDTHGTDVAEAVMSLGAYAVRRFGHRPVVLERDNNVPGLATLCAELNVVYQALVPPKDDTP
ncbi:DUF692 domain-containing protein [Luteibacter aegosomatis]|uniref:DUF692 domain-containing protein n=1 Tax=Luteibacter aegosomatis TaxID=2911537 RepID=UPI001FF9BB90|nr:DUF692 domain-containing protein [Luteibacter aegosomatis]UPG86277.1 DUF692 domain-containing protein [Luteibacter aegosomatis]